MWLLCCVCFLFQYLYNSSTGSTKKCLDKKISASVTGLVHEGHKVMLNPK